MSLNSEPGVPLALLFVISRLMSVDGRKLYLQAFQPLFWNLSYSGMGGINGYESKSSHPELGRRLESLFPLPRALHFRGNF